MNVRHTLICVFFLSLWDGDNGLVNAEILVHTGTEGGNIRVGCTFSFSGRRKIFCKDECEEEDILIETERVNAQSGRYTIEYEEGTYPVFSTLMYVSITNLTKSDSGWYKCGLARSLFPDSYTEFEIRVKDAPITPRATSAPSTSTPMTTAASLSSAPPSASPETTKQRVTSAADPLLYVSLTLVVMVIVLSAAVMIFCRKRASTPKEPPVETEYANVANRVSEEIGEDGRSRSPPAIKYTKPSGVDYSFVTVASSQKKTEDDQSEATYSVVDFSGSTAASLNSAPRGDADNVIYSVPRVEEDPPLYSTVTSCQL